MMYVERQVKDNNLSQCETNEKKNHFNWCELESVNQSNLQSFGLLKPYNENKAQF